MKNLIKQLLRENIFVEAAKAGTPEELVEWLKFLPIDETASHISQLIYNDLAKYYQNDIEPDDQTYSYQPEDKCLPQYDLEVEYRPRTNSYVGYASEQYIEVNYMGKHSSEFKYTRGSGNIDSLKKSLYNIIKHECSHFYLRQRNVENCLYNTHPMGMKKYYNDRQEQVLHSREMFDTFVDHYPNWQTQPIERIQNYFVRTIKNLPTHTRINAPFAGGVQKKYLNFIMKNYVQPGIEEFNSNQQNTQAQSEETLGNQSREIFELLASAFPEGKIPVNDIVDNYTTKENTFTMKSAPINGVTYLIHSDNDTPHYFARGIKLDDNRQVVYDKTFDSFDEMYNDLKQNI